MARFGTFSVFRAVRFGTVATATATGLLMAACGGGSPGPVGNEPGGEPPVTKPWCKVVSGITMCCPEEGMVVSEWQVCRSQAYFGCALAEGGNACTFLTTDSTQPMSDCGMGCGQCMTTGAHGFNLWCGQQQ
jgi:hypothetical protein